MFDAIGIVPWTWGTLETGEMTLETFNPNLWGENEMNLTCATPFFNGWFKFKQCFSLVLLDSIAVVWRDLELFEGQRIPPPSRHVSGCHGC